MYWLIKTWERREGGNAWQRKGKNIRQIWREMKTEKEKMEHIYKR